MAKIIAALVLLPPEGDPPTFRITKKHDDTVQIRAEKDRTLFVVNSPSGIGQAVIERLGETGPKAVVLHCTLKGLESFRMANGKVTLDAAVSVQEGKLKVRQWKDGKKDDPLDS